MKMRMKVRMNSYEDEDEDEDEDEEEERRKGKDDKDLLREFHEHYRAPTEAERMKRVHLCEERATEPLLSPVKTC